MITTRLGDPTGYGRILFGEEGDVQAIVEHKAATPEQLAIPLHQLRYLLLPCRPVVEAHLAEIRTDNPAHEYYLTDIVEILGRAGHTVAAMEVANSAELLGINTRVELAAVDKIFRDRKVRELMLEGVTIEKPETVTIDCGVRIGADPSWGLSRKFLGSTEIGEDCRIGACSIVENSKLAVRRGSGPVHLHRGFAQSRVGRASSVRSRACGRQPRIGRRRAHRQFRGA